MPAPEVVSRPAHLAQHDQLGESPFWDAVAQCLWWVDIVGKRVQRLDGDSGEVRVWAAPDIVSGVLPCESGGLVAALPHGIDRVDLGTGLFTRWIASPDPNPNNRTNEFRVDPWGRLWLGTMWNNIGPNGEDRPVEESTGQVFCIDAEGKVTPVLSGVGITNTFVWSPDGARFYTADTKLKTMWSFAVRPDETPIVADRQVFAGPEIAPGNPDGSAMDEEGCVWTAHWGGARVIRVTPDGRLDRTIDMPVEQPSCVEFGGPDRRTLYITTARQGLANPGELDGALFALPVDVAGQPTRRFAG